MKFILPYPPSCNRYWRVPKSLGRPIMSAEARTYKATAGMEAMRQGARPMEGPLRVSVDFFRPQRSGDLDNFWKVASDSLNGVAWRDDSQVVEIHLRRFDDKDRPRLEVEILPAKI